MFDGGVHLLNVVRFCGYRIWTQVHIASHRPVQKHIAMTTTAWADWLSQGFTSHPTQNRPFWGCSSQPLTLDLVLRNLIKHNKCFMIIHFFLLFSNTTVIACSLFLDCCKYYLRPLVWWINVFIIKASMHTQKYILLHKNKHIKNYSWVLFPFMTSSLETKRACSQKSR